MLQELSDKIRKEAMSAAAAASRQVGRQDCQEWAAKRVWSARW